jgi:hypothetical protein
MDFLVLALLMHLIGILQEVEAACVVFELYLVVSDTCLWARHLREGYGKVLEG